MQFLTPSLRSTSYTEIASVTMTAKKGKLLVIIIPLHPARVIEVNNVTFNTIRLLSYKYNLNLCYLVSGSTNSEGDGEKENVDLLKKSQFRRMKSQNTKEALTLLHWINIKENQESLKHIAEYCQKAMELVSDFYYFLNGVFNILF